MTFSAEATAQTVASAREERTNTEHLDRPGVVVVLGVCHSMARRFRIPAVVLRIIVIAGIPLMLLGPAAYVIAAIFILGMERGTEQDSPRPPRVREHIAPVALLTGALAGGTGMAALAGTVLSASAMVVAPLVLTLVLGFFALTWSFAVDAADPLRSRRYRAASSALIIIVLIGTATCVLASASVGDRYGHRAAVLPFVGAMATLMFLTAAAALIGPRIQRAWAERVRLREERERAAARADLAAHLHDSVLQTLALIQTLSGTTSEVARLARAQERDLRDWLFGGAAAHSDDLETRIRDVATEIEFSYPVSIDTVYVGPFITAPDAIVQAMREALVNAARHAGGSISVLCEVHSNAIDIFVRDRGAGFKLDAIPPERFGVRQSILGRMARAGGRAKIIRLAVGTEVQLSMPSGGSVRDESASVHSGERGSVIREEEDRV